MLSYIRKKTKRMRQTKERGNLSSNTTVGEQCSVLRHPFRGPAACNTSEILHKSEVLVGGGGLA